MIVERPIITSLLDTDAYKINMGSVVFHLFPKAKVVYEFINRNNVRFPTGFAAELQNQINLLSKVRLTEQESEWLKKINYLRPTYIEWLGSLKMNPNEVEITEHDGNLKVKVSGYWYRTIFWEVMLMTLISELYFILTDQQMASDWFSKIEVKAARLADVGCHWIDFGTRRRYSYQVQDMVVQIMKKYTSHFLGTSNLHLAMKYGVIPHGTYAHESVMAMSALYGARMANKMWMKHWAEHFEGNVGVALTDTFTTGTFLQDFGSYEARLFDGVRHDSNDPFIWGENMLNHYRSLHIPTGNKRLVFSDNLNVDKYIALDTHFRQWSQPCGGIGTHFTNDVGVRPLNMVIKMTSADFGLGPIPVVKLSDDEGKHTGNKRAIELVKAQLGL